MVLFIFFFFLRWGSVRFSCDKWVSGRKYELRNRFKESLKWRRPGPRVHYSGAAHTVRGAAFQHQKILAVYLQHQVRHSPLGARRHLFLFSLFPHSSLCFCVCLNSVHYNPLVAGVTLMPTSVNTQWWVSIFVNIIEERNLADCAFFSSSFYYGGNKQCLFLIFQSCWMLLNTTGR